MKSSKDGSQYEYIAVYVDDLAICMKDPNSFCDTLKEKYKLKLKGVGPINYHLGCGCTRDEDGTLVADPRKYVEKILESYEKPLEKNQRRPSHPWWEEITHVEDSSSLFFQISCSQGIFNSSRLSCYLLLRLLVYMYLSQLMRTFTNYLKCIVISS